MTRDLIVHPWPSAEFGAFMAALAGVGQEAPTACQGWTAHDLLAHLVAGTQEVTRLAGESLAGLPVSATRGLDQREQPLRALDDADLRRLLLSEGARLVTTLERLRAADPARIVPFTGWSMTLDQLHTHLRSELALHRWDLVGDDDTSRELLAQPELLAHGVAVMRNMPTLAEASLPHPDHDARLGPADRLLRLWGRR